MSDEHEGYFADIDIVPLSKGRSKERLPTEIEREVSGISPSSKLEDLCAVLDAADWLMARAKSIHHLSRQKAIEWIERNGDFDIGSIHYSVGHYTNIRCTDTKQCGHDLLNNLGGDFDGFLDVLVAQPYKSSFAKRHLPDNAFRQLFRATAQINLISGTPSKVLKRSNTNFMR